MERAFYLQNPRLLSCKKRNEEGKGNYTSIHAEELEFVQYSIYDKDISTEQDKYRISVNNIPNYGETEVDKGKEC